VVGGSGKVVE
jgi:hypothetical protein